MKSYGRISCISSLLLTGLLLAGVQAQSLTSKLEQEGTFYNNYGKDQYTKLKIEEDVVGLYDFFGEHIVDGIHIYELSVQDTVLSNEEIGDSVAVSKSVEMQKKDFYEKFSNLVVTQDAIGGIKTSFMVGDQITTRFTPLTFNKMNFRGVRWDWWSTGLQFTFMLSRTRPGFVAKKEGDDATGTALVEYPKSTESFEEDYYSRGIRGDRDFSSKSPFGDYDVLWAVHAQNNIANKMDVGLTYINHKVNDINRSNGNPFKGQLPDSLMPEHVHFEYYDLTPQDTLDAGVFVRDVIMLVNGRRAVPRRGFEGSFRRAFAGDRDGVLLPRNLPLSRPQSGPIPVIVEFKVDPKFWRYENGSTLRSIKDVKKLEFKSTVAGNYRIFASTDRQIPLSIEGDYNPQTREVDYTHPRRAVGEMYDDEVRIDDNGIFNKPTNTSISTTYFGEYVAQSTQKTSLSDKVFTALVENANRTGSYGNLTPYNYTVVPYEYNINVSSMTFGVDFRGELAGFGISGEVALNQTEDMLPGQDESRARSNKLVGTLKLDRELGKEFGLSGEVYHIAPQWTTSLNKFLASEYFSATSYKQEYDSDNEGNVKDDAKLNHNAYDYMIHPRVLGDPYRPVDDNDDNDAFPENDRRRYPANLNPKDEELFHDDGYLRWGSDTLEGLYLTPSRMFTEYDDPDGVYTAKDDRNENGTLDYLEDFLLFMADPPVFELGTDLNNNGIEDYEDDDILPDYGKSVGYVVTGDGITTQGIQGLDVNLRWTPIDNTTVDFGAVFERVLDTDLLPNSEPEDVSLFEALSPFESLENKSLVGYVTAKHNLLKRSQGLQLEVGNEVRAIRDAIRNDAIKARTNRISENIDIDYRYYIDPLAYRQALVDNLLFTFTYLNVPDLEYILKAKVGAEKHLALSDSVYYPRGIDTQWKLYEDRLNADFHLVNKLRYDLKFNFAFEDWRKAFNALNRLTITPQYKFALSYKKELSGPDERTKDPRSITLHRRLDVDDNGEIDPILDNFGDNLDMARAAWEAWEIYSSSNKAYIMNVPILRASYEIAENTELQLGVQGLRYLDIISPEDNHFKSTVLSQVVSEATYHGYSVTFFVGGRWHHSRYDVHARDPVLELGQQHDISGYELFAKLFSGF